MDYNFARLDLDRTDLDAGTDRGGDGASDLYRVRELWIVGRCCLPPMFWVSEWVRDDGP